MLHLFINKKPRTKQYLISISLIFFVSGICFLLSDYIGYRTVAFVLLVVVSFIAMFFDIFPVLLASLLSALIWNYFFIPPRFTLHISDTQDMLMFLMYFIIAMVNAVLTYKIRQIEKLAQKKEEKQNTLKLYNTLLNSLSHELRTPIATIIGATDNLQTNNNKLSEENKTVLVNEISKASIRLNRHVENLLNMSRLESGVIQLKKDWCDVNELVHSVLNEIQVDIKNHTFVVDIKENFPLFKIDFGIMQQVVHNLIYNAALYTSENSIISINVKNNENNLILIIEDNGTGFPEGEIKNVFEKFYRFKNNHTGGTGLGLSIVKGFVEAHNGKIILENKKEGGARFTITIPAETSYISNLKNE